MNNIYSSLDIRYTNICVFLLTTAHINHIREIAGVDNVGLGAGYDGIN